MTAEGNDSYKTLNGEGIYKIIVPILLQYKSWGGIQQSH